MATATPSQTRGSGTPDDLGDRRVTAFCSPRFPELFHAFAYANDIWKHDPFDVESIHRDAREKFQRIVGRVLEPSGLAAGRILLLLGESGCGKTHLMRAFRNQVHSRSSGYCGYLQMTAFTGQYGRYVLNNLIDSLDKPYDESRVRDHRADAALERPGRDVPGRTARPAEPAPRGGLDQAEHRPPCRRAGRYDHPRRPIQHHRCLPRAGAALPSVQRPADQGPRAQVPPLRRPHRSRPAVAGGIVPCIYPDAPHRIIERLGQLIWAVERVPLVLCVDQLEDVFDLDEAAIKFRRAMATLCDIVSRLPSAIVVIACLDNFYDELKKLLTRPIVDRVENDPPPVGLQSPCDRTRSKSSSASA